MLTSENMRNSCLEIVVSLLLWVWLLHFLQSLKLLYKQLFDVVVMPWEHLYPTDYKFCVHTLFYHKVSYMSIKFKWIFNIPHMCPFGWPHCHFICRSINAVDMIRQKNRFASELNWLRWTIFLYCLLFPVAITRLLVNWLFGGTTDTRTVKGDVSRLFLFFPLGTFSTEEVFPSLSQNIPHLFK